MHHFWHLTWVVTSRASGCSLPLTLSTEPRTAWERSSKMRRLQSSCNVIPPRSRWKSTGFRKCHVQALSMAQKPQELERKAKETKDLDEWHKKCGKGVWKDRSRRLVAPKWLFSSSRSELRSQEYLWQSSEACHEFEVLVGRIANVQPTNNNGWNPGNGFQKHLETGLENVSAALPTLGEEQGWFFAFPRPLLLQHCFLQRHNLCPNDAKIVIQHTITHHRTVSSKWQTWILSEMTELVTWWFRWFF